MTTTTFTLFNPPLTRFDLPLLGVASDAVHLFLIWPGYKLSLIGKVGDNTPSEELKRKLFRKQHGRCLWPDCFKGGRFDSGDEIEVDHVWPKSKGGRNWTLNLQLLHKRCNQEKFNSIEYAADNVSPLLPYLVAWVRWLLKRPRILAAVVGGIALVVATLLAVKWLRQHIRNVRRRSRLASRVRSNVHGMAQRVRGVAGQIGHGPAHRVLATAGELPARAGSAATRIRDASPKSLPRSAGNALRIARRAGGLIGESARTTAGRVKSGASHAPSLAQGAAVRVTHALPRAHVGRFRRPFPEDAWH